MATLMCDTIFPKLDKPNTCRPSLLLFLTRTCDHVSNLFLSSKRLPVSVATWIGGSFIVGTVEMVNTPSIGLTGTVVVLLAYSSSFIVGKTSHLTGSLMFAWAATQTETDKWGKREHFVNDGLKKTRDSVSPAPFSDSPHWLFWLRQVKP